ncbi:hypothetical protein LP419_17275 [Massilia sp. H-1]|nr:hypothetical protein LP419_17275 [Massilia sp. H-1]
MKASMDRFQARAMAARTPGEMYLAATELAASVRCGHTWTNVLNQQGPARRQILEAADKLPLIFTLVEGRWLVLGSTVPEIAVGDEIVTIDGKTAAQVVAAMMPYLRADGSSDGKRLRQLGHDRPDYSMMDIVWPLLSPPVGGSYRLEVRNSKGSMRKVAARAVTLAARDAALESQTVPGRSETWTFRIEGERAVMTLPTFSVHRSKFNWQRFFVESFDELKRKQVQNLVIDIRDNEGGDGAVAPDLMSYLVKAPASYVADQSVTTYEKVLNRAGQLSRHLGHGFLRPQRQRRQDHGRPAGGPLPFPPQSEQGQRHRAAGDPLCGKSLAAGRTGKQFGNLCAGQAGQAARRGHPGRPAYRRQRARPERGPAGLGELAELRRRGRHSPVGAKLQRRHAGRERHARHRGRTPLRGTRHLARTRKWKRSRWQ